MAGLIFAVSKSILIAMKSTAIIATAVTAMEIATPIGTKEAVSHFTIRELTYSVTAHRLDIDNTPPPDAVVCMRRLIDKVLEPARRQLGAPIKVNSGYRCKALNRAVGGVERSYHLAGRAADITTGSVAGNRVLWSILHKLPHTELIWEGGGAWIHVAL